MVAGAECCAGLIVSMVLLGDGGIIRRGVPGWRAARAVCGRVISVVRVPVVGSVAMIVVLAILLVAGAVEVIEIGSEGAEWERPNMSSLGLCRGRDEFAGGGAEARLRFDAVTPAAALSAEDEAVEAAEERLERETEESVDRAEEIVGRRRCLSSRSVAEGKAGEG